MEIISAVPALMKMILPESTVYAASGADEKMKCIGTTFAVSACPGLVAYPTPQRNSAYLHEYSL